MIRMEDLPLEDHVREIVSSWGITALYPPQAEVIKRGLHRSGNFILASATASGKTLIAEISSLYSLFKGEKVLYVVPLRALASEKYSEISKHLEPLGYNLRISVGDYDSSEEPLSAYDVIITTYEKLDSIIRHSPSWLSDVGTAVFDEIHYVGAVGRGAIVEMTVAKFMDSNPDARRIALSATITNLEELARWLDADYVSSSWRPVPLKTGVFSNDTIMFEDGEVVRVDDRDDDLINLLRSDICSSQTLIFCGQRRTAVNLAVKIANKIGEGSKEAEEISRKIAEADPYSSMHRVLSEIVAKGVAFHHAGLSHDVRSIIEEGFRRRIIRFLTATPTLAAGVNLPARTVIIKDYKRYDQEVGFSTEIPVFEIKQMMGRAGRPVYDERGYGIIMARSKKEARTIMERYIKGIPEPIASRLNDLTQLRAQILSVIAMKGRINMSGLRKFLNRTLFSVQIGVDRIRSAIRSIVEFLAKNELIYINNEMMTPTLLGKRTSELYIDPVSAIMMRDSIERASVLLSSGRLDELESCLFQTLSFLPDMPQISVVRGEEFSEEEFDALIPIERLPISSYADIIRAIKSYYVLKSWIEEMREGEIEKKFGVEPGDLHRFVETASWMLYSFSEISRLCGKEDLARFLREESMRVQYGIRKDLIELVKLEGVGRVRARALYRSGFVSIREIARAKPEDLMRVPGIGEVLAKRIINDARRRINNASSPDRK
ncbi:MAG: DEAD/DEAH box helicase [Candidatus Methanodesulfokora sp.]|jgi:helicase